MLFSIVIPVYGTERYLPRCLDSLVAQTDRDFEAIVIDDCSPSSESKLKNGGTASEIAARYDERFRCIRHETNRSAFQARRTGIAAAKGDYIVPVDPDDYLMPETLARLRETVGRTDPDIVSYWMDYDDGTRVTPHWCRHPAAVVTGDEALQELVDHKYFTGVASKAFRRTTIISALAELAAPRETYVNTCDDFLMLVSALMFCRRFAFVDYAGYRYFLNEASTSFSWRRRAGFRLAWEQMRLAGSLLERLADQADIPMEKRRLVKRAVDGIEDWFRQMKRDSMPAHRLFRKLAHGLKKMLCFSRLS